MKKLLVALGLGLLMPPAQAMDERTAVRVARLYSEAVACQLEAAHYQAAEVTAGDATLDGLGAIHVVYWQGDLGCAGGSGTVLPNFTVVEHRGLRSTSPIVVTDYPFPELDLRYVDRISSSNGELHITGVRYGPDDAHNAPTEKVSYRVGFDGARFFTR